MVLRRALAAVLGLSALLAAAPQDPELKIPLTGDKLTVSEVEGRIQKLKEDKTLQEAAKTPLQSAYGDALLALQEAVKAQSTRDKLTALKSGAAEKRASLKQELAAPTVEATEQELQRKAADALSVELQQAQTASGAATRKLQLLDEEIRGRAERQKTLPQEIVGAEARVRQAEERLQTAKAIADPLVAAAQQTLAAARHQQAVVELEALRAEQDTHGLASELLALERDVAQKQDREARKLADLLQRVVRKKQQAEAARAAQQAQRTAERSKNEVLRKAGEETAEYARRSVVLSQKLAKAERQLAGLRQERERIEKSFKDSQSNIRQWGLTELLGDSLRNERGKLQGVQTYRRERQLWATENKQIFSQLARINGVQMDRADFVHQVLKASKGLSASGRESLRADAEAVFEERQQNIDRFSKIANQLSQRLWELETASLSLLALAEDFEDFLDEKILWIRSNTPVWSLDWGGSLVEYRDAMDSWSDVRAAAAAGFAASWVWVLLVLALAALARLLKGRLHRYREDLGTRAAKGSTRAFTPTLAALVVTLVLALPVPLVLMAAWLLFRRVDGLGFPAAGAAQAFRWTALFLFLVGLLRQVVGRRGLAESHFGWTPLTARLLRRSSTWAVLIGAPLMWLVLACGNTSGAKLLGRAAFIVGMGLMLLILWRVFRPRTGLLSPGSGLVLTGMLRGARTSVFLLAVAAPVALASLAISGFYFTAIQLSARVLTTLGLLMALLVLSAIITRWRLVTKRSIIFEQRRQQLLAQRQAASDQGTEIPAEPSADQLDVVQVDAQTRTLISTVLVVVGILGVVAIWAGVFPALSLREAGLWQTTTAKGDIAWITLADVILALITVVLTIVAALNVPGFLKLTLFRRMKPGNQYAAATLVQYGIVVVGIVLGFAFLGVGWSKVQWLVAAVSLGLGFGLQEIFANFVSGLILLFEQPIRVGDFITVGDTRGQVTRIRIRATTIRNLDRQELVVPNKEFITGRVVNWTLTDTINRITVVVGIAYGSNVGLARETLMRVARENPYTVDEPRPKVMFREFGDSALLFELRIYIGDLDDWVQATDTIHSDIDREFRKAGIEIAFPQRDLHVRSVDRPLPFEMSGAHPDAGANPDPGTRPDAG